MTHQPDQSDQSDQPDQPEQPYQSDQPEQPDAIDVDQQLTEVERFIAAVQSGSIGTSEAMARYRDTHRPAIARLRAELDAFEALLAPDLEPEAPGSASQPGGERESDDR
jgi:hypothetical protein